MEGQAFAKEHMVRSMLDGGKQHISDSDRIKAVDSEIKWLINDPFYRNRWAECHSIEKDDKPLTSVPEAFHLSNNLLSSIWTFPKVPLKPENKTISEIQENPNEVYDYFFTINSPKERTISADKLLEKLLFNENIKPEKIQQDLEMVHFLLKLMDNEGKPIFDEFKLANTFWKEGCFEGIEESKLLKEAGKKVDSNGKKIFPENFSEKVKGMRTSEFSNHIANYLDTVNPAEVPDLDSDLLEIEEKIMEKKPSPRPKLRSLLKEASGKPEPPKKDKTSTIINVSLAKNRRQAGG